MCFVILVILVRCELFCWFICYLFTTISISSFLCCKSWNRLFFIIYFHCRGVLICFVFCIYLWDVIVLLVKTASLLGITDISLRLYVYLSLHWVAIHIQNNLCLLLINKVSKNRNRRTSRRWIYNVCFLSVGMRCQNVF